MHRSPVILLILLSFFSLGQTIAQDEQIPLWYRVQPGDSPHEIIRRFDLKPQDFYRWNQLSGTDLLPVGERIIIGRIGSSEAFEHTSPSASRGLATPVYLYYTVKPGDTFYKIAREHQQAVANLQTLNPKINVQQLQVGQELVVGIKPDQIQQEINKPPSSISQSVPGISSSPPLSSSSPFHDSHPRGNNSLARQMLEVQSDMRIFAVIVGVSDYPNVRKLRYTDDDAYIFYSFLRSVEGGAVPSDQIAILVDENATREKILRAMKEKFSQADENDLIAFYYAGHGIPQGLIPFDYQNGLELTYQEIAQSFDLSRAYNRIAVVDACYSGQGSVYTYEENTSSAQALHAQILSNAHDKFHVLGHAGYLASAKDEESIEVQDVRHGVFTYYLIEGMKGAADQNGDKMVSLQELEAYVSPKVKQVSQGRQNPSLFGSYNDDYIITIVRD